MSVTASPARLTHRATFPSGPRSMIPGYFALALQRDPIAFLRSTQQKFGDLAHFSIGSRQLFLVSRPELIQDILVTHQKNFTKGRALQMAKRFLGEGLLTSEGEHHTRQRRLAQPAFHHTRIPQYGNAMVEYAARVRERWREGGTLDLHTEMMRLTLAIVGKTLFDADVEGDAKEIGAALAQILGSFERVSNPFAEILARLPLASNRRFMQARERIDATIFRMIDEHRASGVDRGDLLSLLIAATDEGTGMTDRQLRDEAITIFLAGHETTANALTWAFYLLSQNPDAEAKLHAELDAVLGTRLPAVSDLPQLKYTGMIVNETLRLYPPAWLLGRQAKEEYALGDFIAPARSFILMSQYLVQRDARYFPDPERFAPERWTPEFQTALPKYAYFPFGGGARKCIGDEFAWMEGALLIATLAQEWKLRFAPGQKIGVRPQITLRPRYGMKMILDKR